jgi:endonuclease III
MASSNRSTKIGKIHKVLKKAGYEPVAPDPHRTVLEHLLFAACLEDAKYDEAEQAFAALGHNFFDWNEVRVTTVRELAEEMTCLPAPPVAAERVKQILQAVFEDRYAFDLEELRKENLGPATDQLRKTKGNSPFTVSYVIQAALGGHSVPIDAAAMKVMVVLDLVKEKDTAAGSVPGLERAIPKNKGVEFGSLLHRFAVEFAATPHKPDLKKILLEIDPEAGPRLPKRRAKAAAKETQAPKEEAAKKSRASKATTKKAAAQPKKAAAPPKKAAAPPKKAAAPPKKAAAPPKKAAAPPKKAAAPPKKAAAQPKKAAAQPKKAAKAKSKQTPPKSSKKAAAPQKTAKTKAGKSSSQKRSTSKGLSKKKPR